LDLLSIGMVTFRTCEHFISWHIHTHTHTHQNRYDNVAFEHFGIAGKGGAQLYRFELNDSKTGFVDNVTEVVDFVVVRPSIVSAGGVYFSETKSFGLKWTYFGFNDIDQVVQLTSGTIRQWTRGIVDAGKGRKEKNIVGGFRVILKRQADSASEGGAAFGVEGDNDAAETTYYFLAFDRNRGRRYLDMSLFHIQDGLWRLSQANMDQGTSSTDDGVKMRFSMHVFEGETQRVRDECVAMCETDSFKQSFYGTLDKIAHRERSLSVDLERIMTRSMNVTVVERDEDETYEGKYLISKEEFLENFVGAWEIVCDIKDENANQNHDELKSLIAPILLMGID